MNLLPSVYKTVALIQLSFVGIGRSGGSRTLKLLILSQVHVPVLLQTLFVPNIRIGRISHDLQARAITRLAQSAFGQCGEI